jgi:hypothetical protein
MRTITTSPGKSRNRKRERRIGLVQQRLLRKSVPRLLVTLILLLTGLAGFLASFSLLHLGMSSMWLRFPTAILIAYCVFLLLLRLWLWMLKRGVRGDIDLSGLDFSYVTQPPSQITRNSASGISFDLDLEEGWLVVLAIAAMVAGLVASFYVIYIAPSLLAEILVDGALVAGLYKRVNSGEQRHWLNGALRQTVIPAILVALFFTIAGVALHKAAPEAHTVGEVWHHVWRG